eukprot:14987323-Alexandrium_andersonii.AAC.1
MVNTPRALREATGETHERRPVRARRGRHFPAALLGREPQVRATHAKVVCPSSQRSKARTGSWA